MIGTILAGKYKIEKKIASGGMGIVYKALDTTLERYVAIKRLLENNSKDQIIREARNTAKLNHHNICQVFEVVEEGGESFLVMEFIDGHTLSELINTAIKKDYIFSEAFTMAIADEILSGLEHAHFFDENKTHKILHRDLTPNNIMVTKNGNVKILDFGISKTTDPDDKTVTKGADSYNVEYTSPELWKDGLYSTQSYTETNELYSLGLIIYELLCKEKAQPGYSVIKEDYKYTKISLKRPVSEDYERYLECLLSKKPNNRFDHSKIAFANLELLPSYQKSVSRSVIQEELSLLLGNAKVTTAKRYRDRVKKLSLINRKQFLLKEIGLSLMIIFISLIPLVHLLGFIGQEELDSEAIKLFKKIQSTRLTGEEIDIVKEYSKYNLMLYKQIGYPDGFFYVEMKYNGNKKNTLEKQVEEFNKILFEIEKYYINNRDKIIENYIKFNSLSVQATRNSVLAGDVEAIRYGFLETLMILDLWYYGFHKEDSSTLVEKLKEHDLISNLIRKNSQTRIFDKTLQDNVLIKMHILKLLKPKVFLSKEFKTWLNSFELQKLDVYQERIAEELLQEDTPPFLKLEDLLEQEAWPLEKFILHLLKPLGFYNVLVIENIYLNKSYREFNSLNKLGPKMISNEKFMKDMCTLYKKKNEFKILPLYNIFLRSVLEDRSIMINFCRGMEHYLKSESRFKYLKRNFSKDFNIFDFLKTKPALFTYWNDFIVI